MGQALTGAALNKSQGACRVAKLRKNKASFLMAVRQALGSALVKRNSASKNIFKYIISL